MDIINLNIMRYIKHISAFFAVLFLLVGALGIAARADQSGQENAPARKIVVFQKDISDADQAAIIADVQGIRLSKMQTRNFSVVQLGQAAAEKLAKHEGVLRVDDDIIVEALEASSSNVAQKSKGGSSGSGSSSQPAQVLPWGIDRIDAEQVWPLGARGAGVNVGVIDTGISVSHPDLATHIQGGVSEVRYTKNYNDDNGHGSHVAGIIGAIDNTIGVVGAAPSVNLWAIKALDRNGSGYLSDIINGIDWAIAHHMNVINMSLGASVDIQSFHDAVMRAHDAGVVVVAAAGNSGGSVLYPAAYPEAIAVAAIDITNTAPYWSSRGPEVDLAAPGVNIYSTYKGSSYATLSGTSMAAPHVAASAALALESALDTAFNVAGDCVAVYDVNCDGAWSPDEIARKLEATATDLGIAGPDDVYGFGLVNAYAAFTR